MSQLLNDDALDQLFRKARTHNAFLDRPVPETTLRALYDLLKWPPAPTRRGARTLMAARRLS